MVQEYARESIVDYLHKKLETDLGISSIKFQPFNTIRLDSVYLYDQAGEKTLWVNEISASIDLFALMNNKIVISSVHLSDFDVHLRKESSSSPLNIQYIIDAFPPGTRKEESQVNLKVSTVHIVNGTFTFDITDKPNKAQGFDANHIAVSDLNAKLSIKSILSDSLNIQVKKITLKEKSGLEISNLTTRFLTQDKTAALKGFRLDLPSSYLELDRCEVDLSNKPENGPSNILDYALFNCVISPSYISPKDVSAFTSSLQYFDDIVRLKGRLSGSMDDLTASSLTVDFKDKMHLLVNAEIRNVRDTKRMYIDGNVDNLSITPDGIEALINNFSQTNNKLPGGIRSAGNIHFNGNISGYLEKLTAFGDLNTDLGNVKTNVIFGINPTKGLRSYVKGTIHSEKFDLGAISNQKDLGNISLDISVDIKKTNNNKTSGSLKGFIHEFEFRKYTYKDIDLDLNYGDERIDGVIDINTNYGKLGLSGLVDWNKKLVPELNILVDAQNIELDDLGIANSFTNSAISFKMHTHLKGKAIDEILGFVHINDIEILRDEQEFRLDKLAVEITRDATHDKLTIASDIINAEVAGNFTVTTLAKDFQNTFSAYFPDFINKPKYDKESLNSFNYKIKVENTELLSNILGLPFTVMKTTRIDGNYDNMQNKLKLDIKAPYLIAKGKHIYEAEVSIKNNSHSAIDAHIKASLVGKKDVINTITLDTEAKGNSLFTTINLSSDSVEVTKGGLSFETLFSKSKDKQLIVDIDFHTSEFVLNKAFWQLQKSHIQIKDKEFHINDFALYTTNELQRINIDGVFSAQDEDKVLKAQLKNIDLAYLFETLAIEALKFGGYATGDVFLSSVAGKPYANTNLGVKDFAFNHTLLGDLSLFSELDDKTNVVVLDGTVTNKHGNKTIITGEIDPLKEALSLYFDANKIDIGFLQLYAQSIFNKISGSGSGKVHLFGNFSRVTVEGAAFIEDGKLGISMLNTDYTFSDSIYLKKDLIYFNDIKLVDKYRNSSLASGKLSHDYFSNFVYYIDLSADNFLLYDTNPNINPLFYGTVFGSGKGSISGDEAELSIDVNMRTKENTKVRMNFMQNIVNEYSFITYKGDTVDTDEQTDKPKTQTTTSPGMAINMNFYIDATPDATVEIVMDPIGGDIIKGNGNGMIQFQWDTKNSPRISGTYNINRGNYNFTFQRLLEKKFTIQDGSSVQFNGDPFNAILNVDATYRVTANLNDLDQNLVKTTGLSTVPVNCILNLTGPLRHPLVNLDLSFPTTDNEVERQIKSLMNTEDMINRQVTYLLLLSKFYTPNTNESVYRTSDFAAVASATLSNQLTKIVSQIDNRWQLGTNIRTSDADFTSTEVELILSSQLLDNRLLINGNFGYRDDPSVKKDVAIIGDVDIEYLLNNSGTWRVKAYNHYNEKYYFHDEKSTQTQGIAIIYRRNFDKLRELIFWKKKKKKTQIRPLPNDSSDYSFIKMKK